MSSFSRDLGISPSLLSRVINGARPMSLKLALQVATALELDELKTNSLILSVIENSSKNAKISKKVRQKIEKNSQINESSKRLVYTNLEIEKFEMMSNWYYFAILNLINLKEFKSDTLWISKQLNLLVSEVQEALERLEFLGLIETIDGKIQRTPQNIDLKTHRSEMALRKFHKQMISKAHDELNKKSDEDFQSRLINGITFACAPEHIEMIKDKIERLQDEVFDLIADTDRNRVYQMNVQFFPLSKSGEQHV